MRLKATYILLCVFVLTILCSSFTSLPSIGDASRNEPVLLKYERKVTVYAPAVTRTPYGYKGVMTKIEIEVIKPGSGDVFISTNTFMEIDMQASARTAAFVACTFAKKNFYEYDFYVKISAEAPIVGGPSAGALMTIGMIAALMNITLNPEATMTGMINPDGTIGPVGGIFEKAEAAYKAGFKLFLIPYGQDIIAHLEGGRIEYINITSYALKKWGLRVIEVSDIYDAAHYLLGIVIKRTTFEWRKPMFIINVARALFNNLYVNASKLVDDARKALTSIKDYYLRRQLEKTLNEAKSLINEAKSINASWPYVAASLCFQAAYLTQYVIYVKEYAMSGKDFFFKTVDEINSTLQNISNDIAKYEHKALSLSSIEILVGAKMRLRYTSDAINTALQYYQLGDILTSLMWLAHAKWRLRTAIDWANYITSVPSAVQFNSTEMLRIVKSITQEYIYEARTVVVYVREVISEVGMLGAANQEAEEASSMLSYAESDFNDGDYLLALAEANEAIVHATIALNLVSSSETLRKYVDLARIIAYSSIGQLVNRGVVPMLSICYYDFAEYYLMKKNDIITALFNYKMASAQSKILSLIWSLYNGTIISTNEQITQVSPHEVQPNVNTSRENKLTYTDLLIFLAGFALGSITVALIVWSKRS